MSQGFSRCQRPGFFPTSCSTASQRPAVHCSRLLRPLTTICCCAWVACGSRQACLSDGSSASTCGSSSGNMRSCGRSKSLAHVHTRHTQTPPGTGQFGSTRTRHKHHAEVTGFSMPHLTKNMCLSLHTMSCKTARSSSAITFSLSLHNKCIAVRKVATPLRELTCHMGSHSVTCHPAEVTFPPYNRHSSEHVYWRGEGMHSRKMGHLLFHLSSIINYSLMHILWDFLWSILMHILLITSA